MMKQNFKSYAVMGLAVGALTMGNSLPIYAAVSSTTTVKTTTTATATTAKQNPPVGVKNGVKGVGTLDLSSLVSTGVITQATATKVTAKLDAQNTARQVEMDKTKTMTAAEKTAYLEKNKTTQKTDPMADMVKDGTLTQTQSDAITALRAKNMAVGGGDIMNLSNLVSTGVITQATADKITAKQEVQNTARQAEMDKTKTMTAAEKTAYLAANKNTQKTDIIADMVKEGTLTQAQADAIKAARPVGTAPSGAPSKPTAVKK